VAHQIGQVDDDDLAVEILARLRLVVAGDGVDQVGGEVPALATRRPMRP